MLRRPATSSSVVGEILQGLANELHVVEEAAHNASMSAVNNVCNAGSHINDLDEEMDTSCDIDILPKLEKEVQEVCGRLACLVDAIGPVFPKSKEHAFQSYLMRLTEEVQCMRLMNEKNALQEKGIQRKIRLLQLEKNSIERAVVGAQKRLMAEEEESRRANELLDRVHEEFSATRKDLHYIVSVLFPDDGDQMKALLAALTAARDSEDSQGWTDISSHQASHVELLLRDLVIELNPASSDMARLTI